MAVTIMPLLSKLGNRVKDEELHSYLPFPQFLVLLVMRITQMSITYICQALYMYYLIISYVVGVFLFSDEEIVAYKRLKKTTTTFRIYIDSKWQNGKIAQKQLHHTAFPVMCYRESSFHRPVEPSCLFLGF